MSSVRTGTWDVGVDRGACIGTGVCAGSAPRHIRISGGKAEPIADSVEPDDAVLDAAEMCPMAAITVTDTASGEVLAPEP